MRTIIKSAPTKSCENDPLPTSLLKEHIDAILTPLTKIVNTSLRNGEFSDNLKEALLQPLIKKQDMDLIFGSFRPVSNLTFLSKLIECVVAVQLMDMAQQTGNYEELQSAYQNHHSTETALLRVKTDILENMDNGRVNFLIMLDLSVAFNTISFEFLTN